MTRALSRIPAHVLNGITVSLGIAVAQVAAQFAGSNARAVVTGAIFATFPHLPDRHGRATRRVLAGGTITSLTAALILAVADRPVALGLVIPAVVFFASMGSALGARAAPFSFGPILAIVFTIAMPPSESTVVNLAFNLLGVGIYATWVFASTTALEERYRVLAVASALGANAGMMRARATMIEAGHGEADPRVDLVDEEAVLATKLDVARELVFSPRRLSDNGRLVAIVLVASELRDVVFASRLDVAALGSDAFATRMRAVLAACLRTLADALDASADRMRGVDDRHVDLSALVATFDDLEHVDDARARLAPAIRHRVETLRGAIDRVETLVASVPTGPAPDRAELLRFVSGETWPLRVLAGHLRRDSPVFRNAVRTSLAIAIAHTLSLALPWAVHPHWIVLTVAVVLRGNLMETITRRDARVLGTALGCVLVTISFALDARWLLDLEVVAATGIAHAFTGIRYLITAMAATVLSLVQIHLVVKTTSVILLERLGDTVIGALFAWAFSYAVPNWERNEAPRAIARTLDALSDYARDALTVGATTAQQLSRQRAYDEINGLALLLRRSAVEPESVRPPADEILTLVLSAQALMAHLSSIRILFGRHGTALADEPAVRSLDASRAELHALLANAGSPERAETTSGEFPAEPIERHAYPWLERRLRIATRDAHQVGAAARAALAKLG